MPLRFLKDGLVKKNIKQNVKDSCFWASCIAGLVKRSCRVVYNHI